MGGDLNNCLTQTTISLKNFIILELMPIHSLVVRAQSYEFWPLLIYTYQGKFRVFVLSFG